MNKGIIFSLSIYLFLTPILHAQNNAISGKAYIEKSMKVIDSVKVELLDAVGKNIKTVYTNKKGVYKISEINTGIYKLFASSHKSKPLMVSGILIDSSKNENIDLPLTNLCQESPKSNVCPFCNKKKKVLRISPGTVLSYNFGDDISSYKKHEKKIRKKGYETYLTNQGERIVISMRLEEAYEKFNSFCYHWFCEKCKKVF